MAPTAPSVFECASTIPGPYASAPVVPFAPDRTVPLAFGPVVASTAVADVTFREPVALETPPISRGPYPSAISTTELLERAATLGPARMAWESSLLPSDPILDEKRQPHVAERRNRFTRMVKVGLGACLAVCAIALGLTALSSSSSSSSASSSSTALGKSSPSNSIVPIEALDGTRHAKAVRRSVPTVAAALVRPKRR